MNRLFTTATALEVFLTVYFPRLFQIIFKDTMLSKYTHGYVMAFSLTILQFIFVFAYIILLSLELKKRLPEGIKISNKYFMLCVSFIFIILFFITLANVMYEGKNPWEIIVVIGMISSVLGFVYASSHLAKLLITIEQQQNIPARKTIPTTLQFLFFIFGVWALQPRIRKAMAVNEMIQEN